MELPLEVTPADLQAKLAAGERIRIIDVREPEEYSLSHLPASDLVPMQSVPAQLQRLEAIADEEQLAVLCHHGVRSLNVALWLRQRGLENCFSVSGGIDRWSREIDPNIPRY